MTEFRLPEKLATIELGDGDFAGAEVVVRLRVPLAVFREIVELSAASHELATVDRLCEMIAQWSLVSWNLADHLGPIPATLEGLTQRLDAGTIAALVSAWMRVVVEPPAPLSLPSSDGTPSRRGRNRRNSTSPSSRTKS